MSLVAPSLHNTISSHQHPRVQRLLFVLPRRKQLTHRSASTLLNVGDVLLRGLPCSVGQDTQALVPQHHPLAPKEDVARVLVRNLLGRSVDCGDPIRFDRLVLGSIGP